MARSIPSNPTEKPNIIPSTDHPALTRVTAARVPDNQPPADKMPTVRWSQIIRNMKSTTSKSRYALATHVITAMNILSHYDSNTVIGLIT